MQRRGRPESAHGLGQRKAVFARNGLSPTARHRVEATDVSGRVEVDGVAVLR